MMATEMQLTVALKDEEAQALYAATNTNHMIQVLHNYWDNICMQGLAITPEGQVINISGSFAMAPALMMYDLTNQCHIHCDNWEWNYTDY